MLKLVRNHPLDPKPQRWPQTPPMLPSSVPLLIAAAFLTVAPVVAIALKAKVSDDDLPDTDAVRLPQGVRPLQKPCSSIGTASSRRSPPLPTRACREHPPDRPTPATRRW